MGSISILSTREKISAEPGFELGLLGGKQEYFLCAASHPYNWLHLVHLTDLHQHRLQVHWESLRQGCPDLRDRPVRLKGLRRWSRDRCPIRILRDHHRRRNLFFFRTKVWQNSFKSSLITSGRNGSMNGVFVGPNLALLLRISQAFYQLTFLCTQGSCSAGFRQLLSNFKIVVFTKL